MIGDGPIITKRMRQAENAVTTRIAGTVAGEMDMLSTIEEVETTITTRWRTITDGMRRTRLAQSATGLVEVGGTMKVAIGAARITRGFRSMAVGRSGEETVIASLGDETGREEADLTGVEDQGTATRTR